MAGTKETPRQKLIGVMYLILLALLALQVSSAVIFKFEQLNKNMDIGGHFQFSTLYTDSETMDAKYRRMHLDVIFKF